MIHNVHNGILLSHKRNAFESVLMRWMKLEPIIQSEVNTNTIYTERKTPIQYINTYIENLGRW